MKTVLITGSKGQLGSELQERATYIPCNFILTDFEELDISNSTAIASFFKKNSIDYVINCAAYTAVDKAEVEQEQAKKINTKAVQNLAEICASYAIPLIHISTDYVFDGTNHKPYTEDDRVNPQSVYGSTKLEGERIAMSIHPQTIIIRTSWLYSSYGNNFVKTMIRLGEEKKSLSVIFDQIGSPTYAADLAECILGIIKKIETKKATFKPGIYHYSNEGVCSWFDFAKEIHALSGISCKVSPIETKDYPTPATRPHYSILNKSKIKQTYGIEIPYWKSSLKTCLKKIL